MKKKSQSMSIGKPRKRRFGKLFALRRISLGLFAVFLVLSGIGLWWAVSSGAAERGVVKLQWHMIAVSSQVGFKVEEILVIGRRETDQQELLKAVRLARGAPILAFDLSAARKRIESLPWIKFATVERMLPDTILLNVEEREPVAIWQNKGKFSLIDRSGEIILHTGLQRFSDLIVVVGEDAPRHAARLLKTLSVAPELIPWVKAAVWVGGRRWNVRLKGKIDVRLPEIDPAGAWLRLAEYEKTHNVLERDVQVLDLRIPDRLIVRRAPPQKKSVNGQET
tara:strand:+ start:4166 stop:5005 length:840 start_codon:yes stop_codon:yes gene_type:complete